MRTLLRQLAVATSVALAAFVFSMTNAGQALAQNMKPVLVQVINTSAEAVPVTGIVRVANAANAPLTTRDVSDFPASNAFSEEIRLVVSGSAGASFTIPPGKRLVVECVSVRGSDTLGSLGPEIALRALVEETPTDYHLAPTLIESSSGLQVDVFAATQLVRFYADALTVGLSRTEGVWNVTVSGYLVDQP